MIRFNLFPNYVLLQTVLQSIDPNSFPLHFGAVMRKPSRKRTCYHLDTFPIKVQCLVRLYKRAADFDAYCTAGEENFLFSSTEEDEF